ncbi:cation:dicarboxylate symporter family transporter [Stutzerimonas stutzeri]|uniref:cation:dicarboxylate symporter family transporter n=1 Tax=Stutzerimonas stutzeri TaxID=316 RepID=UPI0002912407|nr:cation:dicarboxylase symporter family transporter [Stutzerimonas stutzeri]
MILSKLYRNDTVLLLFAIALGLSLGIMRPLLAIEMKPLSDAFLGVIGHAVPLVMFVLVSSAVAGFGERGQKTRCAGRVMAYFLLMAVLSLITGAAVATLLAPGLDAVSFPVSTTQPMHDLPAAVLTSLAQVVGHTIILPVLLAALLFGLGLGWAGDAGEPLRRRLDVLVDWLLKALRMLLKFAPLAAFGAMAYTVGRYGPASAWPLLKFVGTVYFACLLFIVVVMGVMARLGGIGLFRLIAYIKAELCLVAFTGASVAAVPGLIEKLERAGCGRREVRLVLSTGYTFNLAGSNIYVTCAAVFLAQLAGIALDGMQLSVLLMIALLTSLGSTSAAGSAFLTLTATVAGLNLVPLEALGLLLGVERLMKCRSLTNVIGNSLACVVVSAWAGALDRKALREALEPRRQVAFPGSIAGKR